MKNLSFSTKAARIVSHIPRHREDTFKGRRPAKAARSERRYANRQIMDQLLEAA